jgi:antitoxin HicB
MKLRFSRRRGYANKRVIAWQLQQEITAKGMTKTAVAEAMGISLGAVDSP